MPFTNTAAIPHWSSVEDELLVADRQPALEPARGVEHEVHAREDRRHGTWRPTRRPPARRRPSRRTGCRPSGTGTPSRRASAAMTYSTQAGSGVPKVGAPDCIEIDDAKRAEDHRGARAARAGRTPCPPSPRRASGRRRRRSVTGDIAPARMNGVIERRLVGLGVDARAPSIVASQTSGEFALIRLSDHRVVVEVRPRRTGSAPSSTVSARAVRVRDRAHERLVRPAHVAVDHVEVALVDRQVDGLADRARRVVQVRASCR